MKVDPPPTRKELDDLRQALRHNVPEPDFINNEGWYRQWFEYLIGLRRGYQKRFLTEAYNENSTSS